jgi:hypothetical protein
MGSKVDADRAASREEVAVRIVKRPKCEERNRGLTPTLGFAVPCHDRVAVSQFPSHCDVLLPESFLPPANRFQAIASVLGCDVASIEKPSRRSH